ncbi:uncharacterized mitochondrial protein AtMg00810-like [Quercus suber]|uniref:uncharacterized mitochondrial protein AtMg00810-like n=1 Tax=Quercus suber TaxID=58331 RepID=UPI000CE1CD6B|nr:uncharacterized protein LOC111985744 [Quercus suber]
MVGELTFFLGFQVKQKKESIFVSQEKYARNIVKKFGLDSKKHASTPISSSTKLNADSSRVEVSPTLYRSIIGSLLCLTASRPDIAFSVDADWAGSVDARKSTSGGCFYLGNNLVS